MEPDVTAKKHAGSLARGDRGPALRQHRSECAVDRGVPHHLWDGGRLCGHDLAHIESGAGIVHNSLMEERTRKKMVQAPFRPFPRSARHRHLTMAVKPPWFLSNRAAADAARQVTSFAADPNPAAHRRCSQWHCAADPKESA